MFKKNNVYLTRTYNVDRTGPIDLMTRVSSVGEYFKMVPKLNRRVKSERCFGRESNLNFFLSFSAMTAETATTCLVTWTVVSTMRTMTRATR